MNEPIYAFDYETYYSKTYTIRDLGNYAYTHHEEFNCYMLSVAGADGFKWVGDPKGFDWSILQGAFMIAHNAGFESAVTQRLVELGIAPRNLCFAQLVDTADLAAYLGYPRSLAQAAELMLGVKPDKTVRTKAQGKQWDDMDADEQKAMTAYAMEDSVLELRLWMEHAHKWPEHERQISQITREMCDTGLPVSRDRVRSAIDDLEHLLAAIRAQIPWTLDEQGANLPEAKALSKKEVAAECAKIGIKPPKSMAKTSEEFDEWLRVNGENATWAKAMGQYRSVNAFLLKLKVMLLRTKADGTMPYSLKYAGAHTLRDSGDAGLNVQNLAREAMFGQELIDYGVLALCTDLPPTNPMYPKLIKQLGVDMRGMIEAPEGKMIGVVDLSSIEPCSGSVLSGDAELMALLESGMDPYEAQARIDGEYDGDAPLKDVDKALRQYNKVKVLGCGYGAGPDKVQIIARTQVGLELSLEQCTKIVYQFRSRKFIPDTWKALEAGMRASKNDDFEMEVPNGGSLLYRNVLSFGSLSAEIPRQGRMMRLKFWGGTLYENLVQRVARDVFMDRVLALYEAGLPPILRVHDEAVFLFDAETADSDLATAIRIMSTKPAWMPNLPLGAEGHLCKRYSKG